MKTTILAIDGGGIRGILPATFLALVEEAFQSESLQVYQMFDLIGGTSTGGIIAIGLTTPSGSGGTPRSAREVLELYTSDCHEIFVPVEAESGPLYYADQKDLLDEKRHGIEVFLRSILGDGVSLATAARSLSSKKRVRQVFTTTYVVNSTGGRIPDPVMGVDFGPYLFNWQDALEDSKDDYYLWEAARGTSAAPTYFPLANVGGGKNGRSQAAEKWVIDGGVMSNDPAVWALAEAMRQTPGAALSDFLVVSVGTGVDANSAGLGVTNQAINHQPYGQKYGFWGKTDWLTELEGLNDTTEVVMPILETALYANQFVPAMQLQSLAVHGGLEYYRVQAPLPNSLTPMDRCKNTSALQSFAHRYFKLGPGKPALDAVVAAIRKNL